MATKQQIMASVWNSILIGPAVDILERQDGKIDIYNRSNKTKIQQGQYEYLPLAKRLYKKELPTIITQLYQADDIDTRIKEAFGQAMQYYGEILTQRQHQIGDRLAFFIELILLEALDAFGAVKSYSYPIPFMRAKIMLFVEVADAIL
ncbi:MAG: hypothetical protein EZS28_016860 [Streblomastix strix]|uniref:Uncharacterized protein n=1 Tax=Streblomastix strix TaxID=222440 RepID=A0A5J4VY79_9EUKA|nr:MAG: hypothetical protein EZS28_016860 [Streblomastix strix]